MELTIPIIISIIGCIFGIISFAFNRQDKTEEKAGSDQYKMGVLETKIDQLGKQVEKVLEKLDTYDIEIDEKINKAIENHIAIYHKKNNKEGK